MGKISKLLKLLGRINNYEIFWINLMYIYILYVGINLIIMKLLGKNI